MIYLFEDRKDRMNIYLDQDIKKFQDILDADKIINANILNLKTFIENLENLEVLMLHRSYSFIDKSISPDNVKEIVKKAGKKFVLFSGGVNNVIIDENEIILNSGDFYKNLPSFLLKYKTNNDTSLLSFFFKNEKEFNLHQLKKFQNEVLSIIITNKNENDEIRLYKKIKNLIDSFLLSDVFTADKEKLKDLLSKSDPISKETLFNQLIKMISKYENN